MLSKSIFVALLSVMAVAADRPFPDWIGAKSSGKSVHVTDDFTASRGSYTLAPTVTTPPKIQPTVMPGEADPAMPDHTPHPPYANSSLVLMATAIGTGGFPGNSKNISRTVSVKESYTIAPNFIANGTTIKPTGTATPRNGTNRTTSPTLSPMPSSLGSTIIPYGATFLVVLVGFVAMGL